MGTQKSHFAYRLAWDNTFSERIPFLPLHRRDLVSAEEGNRTFVGDTKSRINWRKFEVMGEVVLGIQRSQKTPYPHLQRYEDAARLILDIKLSGDDEVRFYALSALHLCNLLTCLGFVCTQFPGRALRWRRDGTQKVRLVTVVKARVMEHFTYLIVLLSSLSMRVTIP